jgi:hypothetical protein
MTQEEAQHRVDLKRYLREHGVECNSHIIKEDGTYPYDITLLLELAKKAIEFKEAAKKMLKYWDLNYPENFQGEKMEDFILMFNELLIPSKKEQV